MAPCSIVASGLYALPKFGSADGTPPTCPDSVVMMIWSLKPSSDTTLATSAAMPTPRFTTSPRRSSMAQRRAMTLRSDSGMGGIWDSGFLICPENAGSKYTPSACQQASWLVACTT